MSCRDEGIGIEPQDAERVFAILQRLHPKGSGLPVVEEVVW